MTKTFLFALSTAVVLAAASTEVRAVSGEPRVGLSPALQDPAGKPIYAENCQKCHGMRGTPPKTMKAKFPKIATFDAEFFTKRTDDSVVTVLTKGKGEDMKSFKDKMSPAEMKQVAAYIRTLGTKPSP